MASKIRVDRFIATAKEVALAIWEVLENCGNRIFFGIFRKPYASGKSAAVGHRNPTIFDLAYPARKLSNNFQQGIPSFVEFVPGWIDGHKNSSRRRLLLAFPRKGFSAVG